MACGGESCAKSICFAECGDGRDYGISTDICEEIESQARGKIELCGFLPSSAPRADLDLLFTARRMSVRKLWAKSRAEFEDEG